MYLQHLTLLNYRNYRQLDVEMPRGPVVLHGDNAQGKTNFLEAVYLLSIAKSFRADNEREVLTQMLLAPTDDAATQTGIEDYQALVADIHATVRELNTLVAAAQSSDVVNTAKTFNQLISNSLDQAGQEGETLIYITFRQSIWLILIAVAALLVAQILFVYIKKRM